MIFVSMNIFFIAATPNITVRLHISARGGEVLISFGLVVYINYGSMIKGKQRVETRPCASNHPPLHLPLVHSHLFPVCTADKVGFEKGPLFSCSTAAMFDSSSSTSTQARLDDTVTAARQSISSPQQLLPSGMPELSGGSTTGEPFAAISSTTPSQSLPSVKPLRSPILSAMGGTAVAAFAGWFGSNTGERSDGKGGGGKEDDGVSEGEEGEERNRDRDTVRLKLVQPLDELLSTASIAQGRRLDNPTSVYSATGQMMPREGSMTALEILARNSSSGGASISSGTWEESGSHGTSGCRTDTPLINGTSPADRVGSMVRSRG
ncbi:unnamed protein product, partial [Choristocarpus tenellus]